MTDLDLMPNFSWLKFCTKSHNYRITGPLRLVLCVTSCLYKYRENQDYIPKVTALQLFFVISVIPMGQKKKVLLK